MNSKEKFDWLKTEFHKLSATEKALPMEAYMRYQFKYLGLSSSTRVGVYARFLKVEKALGVIDWDLILLCYANEYREFQYFAVDYLRELKEFLVFDDIPKLYSLVITKSWWDTVDVLDRVIGSIAFKDERINALMLLWSTNDNLWVRRISIDHQLLRKEKTNTELLAKIIVNNFGSKEFFINKSIGWALRDYSKTNPIWVKEFLDTHRDKMANLSIREASKYL